MAIYDWPTDLRPEMVDWGRAVPQAFGRSVFDGSVQSAPLGAPRWGFTIDTGSLSALEMARWDAWIDRLDGRTHRARVWDWRRETPLGVATGTPLVRTDSVGTTLRGKGWTPSVTGILLRGSYIGVNGELKRLVVDANSNASGDNTMEIWPPLRATAVVDLPLILVKPTALFICTTQMASMRQDGARRPGATYSFEEVFA